MGYRDDHEALRQRADDLERELVTARAKAERMAELEQGVGTMQERLDAMRAELAGLRPPPAPASPKTPTRSAAIMIAVGLGVVVVMMGVGVTLTLSGESSVPPIAIAPPPPVVPPLPPPVAPPPPAEEPLVDDSVPAAEPRLFEVPFKGAVTQASAAGLARGTACTILAKIRANPPGDARPSVTGLEVACGGRSLYRSTDALEGMSSLSYSAIEMPGPAPGQSVFSLYYTDQGPRTGARSQLSLSSRRGLGVVSRETVPAWKINFSLQSTSAPVAPTNAGDAEPLAVGVAKPLTRAGTVTETSGSPPVGKGAACTLRVEPSFQGARCIATATCSKVKLYDFGSLPCVTEGGELRSLADTNDSANGGDAKLAYDAKTKRLVISDEVAGATWSVTATMR